MRKKKRKFGYRYAVIMLSIIILLFGLLLFMVNRKSVNPLPEVSVKDIDETRESARIVTPRGKKGDIYIVIDDVGYNLTDLKPFLSVKIPLTFSILPELPYSKKAAEMITAARQEYIIHLPMEAINGNSPGPGALLTSMTDETLMQLTSMHIESLPDAAGVNNHMGSSLTSDKRALSAVLKVVKESGKFFLDSYTTAESVSESVCGTLEMTYLKRDVFLDNDTDLAYIEGSLKKSVSVAEESGKAVLIGHVQTTNLPKALEAFYLKEKLEGYSFKKLSEYYEEVGR